MALMSQPQHATSQKVVAQKSEPSRVQERRGPGRLPASAEPYGLWSFGFVVATFRDGVFCRVVDDGKDRGLATTKNSKTVKKNEPFVYMVGPRVDPLPWTVVRDMGREYYQDGAFAIDLHPLYGRACHTGMLANAHDPGQVATCKIMCKSTTMPRKVVEQLCKDVPGLTPEEARERYGCVGICPKDKDLPPGSPVVVAYNEQTYSINRDGESDRRSKKAIRETKGDRFSEALESGKLLFDGQGRLRCGRGCTKPIRRKAWALHVDRWCQGG